MKVRIIIYSLFFFSISCEKDLSYKYIDKSDYMSCDIKDKALLKEALYSFENDLSNYFRYSNNTLLQVYASYIYKGINESVTLENVISQHSIDIFEVLKTKTHLWSADNDAFFLNRKSDLMKCIAKNIKNEDLNTTFNSLLTIKSLNNQMFGPPLIKNYQTLIEDKHLATYVALELYYSKFFNIDLDSIKTIEITTKSSKP